MLTPRPLQYLGKTSPERTDPIIFPKCGTLFTYGNALVISMFCFPGFGRIGRWLGSWSAILVRQVHRAKRTAQVVWSEKFMRPQTNDEQRGLAHRSVKPIETKAHQPPPASQHSQRLRHQSNKVLEQLELYWPKLVTHERPAHRMLIAHIAPKLSHSQGHCLNNYLNQCVDDCRNATTLASSIKMP